MSGRVINDLFFGVSLTFFLFLAVVTVPVIGLAAGLLTPLPIAFYSRKMGMGYGALMVGVVLVLATAVGGIGIGFVFLAEFAAMGMALSESVRMKLPMGRAVMLPTLVSLAGSALLLSTLSSQVDKGLPDIIGDYVRRNVKEAVEVYRKAGVSEEQVKGLTELTERLEALLLKTFPSLVFMGTVSVALLNLLSLRRFLRRKGVEEYQVDPTTWRSPDMLVWLLIAGGFLLLMGEEWASTVGLNLLIISGGIYLFQGLAVVGFYFKKMGTPVFFRVLGYFLIFFQQVFTILVIGFGLFDLWFDFRRLKHKEA